VIRAGLLCIPLMLGGCAGIPIGVLYGLEAASAVATIGKDVVGIDVAISQDTPGKTPIKQVFAPVGQ
jgi:hypothetical protein